MQDKHWRVLEGQVRAKSPELKKKPDVKREAQQAQQPAAQPAPTRRDPWTQNRNQGSGWLGDHGRGWLKR
jgi:hypothetical protein